MTKKNNSAISIKFMNPTHRSANIPSTATDTQIWTAPHTSTVRKRGELLLLTITNTAAAEATVVIWDAYLLGGGTPPARGSAAAPLLKYILPAKTTLSFYNDEFFQGGIAAQSDQTNTFVMVNLGLTPPS